MISQNRLALLLAVNLATLAGFIDALGFRSLGGFFVSFMSGNSTRLAVGISSNDISLGLIPLMIISLFVIGVMAGNTIGHFADKHRSFAVLGFVSLNLIMGGVFASFDQRVLPNILMVIAMGAVNNIFVKEGEVSVGVTYMTGTLVKLGQRLSNIFWGGDKKAWIPYFILWLGLILGAVIGSFSYSLIGLQAIWIGAAFATAICLINFAKAFLNKEK